MMGRQDFDPQAVESAPLMQSVDTSMTSIGYAYFGAADAPNDNNLGLLQRADESSIGTVLGTRVETNDG